jgi:signal transduction histidine kinase
MDRKLVEVYRLSLFGRMVMGVAHEVDNHLSVVIGFSEIIQMTASNQQKVVDGAGKVLAAGEKIEALIKHFSHYVRPHTPDRDIFAPGDMISETLLFSRYDLGRSGGSVVAPATYPAGFLQGDRRDIGLALLALLFNGSEAMADKGGDLAIHVSRDDGGWVISVSDQGTGIPPGFEERIFEEGFTTKPEPFRTGIGLPVARHLFAEAGGTLRLENAPGGGCVATVRLPAVPARHGAPAKG